ncbi:MAG: serine/threonine-protein phosphatase [Desulfobulbaceae bacterium]|nr:serine/threonine-protein phosphatase [Desulfobulbaceae bacterium]
MRNTNQDSFLNWAERKLWAVGDGVGGQETSGAASKTIMTMLMQTPEPEMFSTHIANVTRILEEANSLLVSQKLATDKMAASTIVALLVHGDMAACLWAGDSRCYILRGGILYQCTKDHSLRQEKIDRGDLTVFEAQRMVKGNIITNAVGVKSKLTLGEEVFSIRAGDRFLLCTDGLTNLLSADALMTYLSRQSAKEAVDGIAESLAPMRQPDNITFVIMFVSRFD